MKTLQIQKLTKKMANLSGPVCMPSCIRPKVRLPLDQRILLRDCCKKMHYV